MELLNALLDFVDTGATAVGWVAFWYAWVAPPTPNCVPPPTSDADRLEHFLSAALAARRCSTPTPAAGRAADAAIDQHASAEATFGSVAAPAR